MDRASGTTGRKASTAAELRALTLRSGHWVYLVRCSDGTFYCGYACNPMERVRAHNRGKGSKILRGKLPVKLSYARRLTSKGAALRFEAELKARSHAEKRLLARLWTLE